MSLENLDNIDHIVVLMLENRSFDHMLGYLKLEKVRDDIDGLTGDEVNEFNNTSYSPVKLESFKFKDDPHHDWDSVAEQLEDNNGGFVRNFATIDANDPGRIMGYHNGDDLPVFDSLAEQFCVCNCWFSSVPGPTQPNRAYSFSGTSEGHKDNPVGFGSFDFFEAPTVFHHLDDSDVSWKFYSHDIATLRLNKHYTTSTSDDIQKFSRFREAIRTGDLPAVSWIDPDFGVIPNFHPSNDDHPPHDIRHGQSLVGLVYKLLLGGGDNLFDRTLLIVTYDEHGGFYDHVVPEEAPDDNPEFRRYGVRVPTLIISPWVKKASVSNEIYDHTSIIKTLLLRFCRKPDGTIPDMGLRVEAANDLSSILSEPVARTDCESAPFVLTERQFLTVAEATEELENPSELQSTLLDLRAYCMSEGVSDSEL